MSIEGTPMQNIIANILDDKKTIALVQQMSDIHDPDIFFADLLKIAAEYCTKASPVTLEKAYLCAKSAHAGQRRASGEPYIMHPLAVALTLTLYRFDETTLVAGLLHDVVEDCPDVTIKQIRKEFGEEVASIVEGVTKITQMHFSTKEEAAVEYIRRMILAMAHDVRVIFVKLADRVHNLHTLHGLPPAKRERIARESMEIYAPLANRLGLHRMKSFLEDVSLQYYRPDEYEKIASWVKQYSLQETNLFDKTLNTIKTILSTNDIEATVYGRVKQTYSIYKKIKENNVPIEDLHDIIAFRVIVHSLADCYATLGLIHAHWKFIPSRFKDYISLPKSNGYQSLHTTIFSEFGDRMEVQIRTKQMHELAEYGIAAHWLYKEKNSTDAQAFREYRYWIKGLVEDRILEEDATTFLQYLQLELFQEEVYVFTPKGALIELPEGSTPVDFAYAIHSKIGDHCAAAKINNKMVALHTRLQQGDIVEIVSDDKKEPSRHWLTFVKTRKAKSKIRSFLRKKEQQEYTFLGKNLLEKALRKTPYTLATLHEVNLQKLFTNTEYTHITTLDDVFTQIGSGFLTTAKLQELLIEYARKNDTTSRQQPLQQDKPQEKTENPRTDDISLEGIEDILIEFPSCCSPTVGEPITGYISRGRGIIVHSSTCKNILTMDHDRLLPLQWNSYEHTVQHSKLTVILTTILAYQKIIELLNLKNIRVLNSTFTIQNTITAKAEFQLEYDESTASLQQAIKEIQTYEEVLELFHSIQ